MSDVLETENSLRVPAPRWVSDLVIYEINPRGFTSPRGAGDGHGSGTFRSMMEKLPYLRELGINAIWLAGFHEATDHFYGIWSVYAVKRHERIDPSLGTPEDFRALVDAAHEHGIRVILEAVSHGVVLDSPLIEEHPGWFLPEGSWGMADFDYSNEEFRRWWVELWSGYVTTYGVDGFRVDVSMVDVSLWDEIASRARQAGHPIVVMPEWERYHIGQQDWAGFSPDIAADWNANRNRFSTFQISCHDAGWVSKPGNYYRLRGSRALFGYCAGFAHRVPLFYAGEEFNADQVSLPALRRGLFGAGGAGGWLYGSQMPWGQLEHDPDKQAFCADVRRVLEIRRNHSDLLNADRWQNGTLQVDAAPTPTLVPYVRYRFGGKAMVVAANEDSNPIDLRLQLPLGKLGLDNPGRFRVDDLWNETSSEITDQELRAGLRVEIAPDRLPRGGLAVLAVSPLD